ncbi:MAG: PTS system mannose-specific IIA component [Methylophilaceae bacterium]|jgi:PTS system mannose-specific IIA component|tara:strand:+ start:1740 stop:2120 length:381 start_codon:yes stop_codon:yes gene_type:complete
MIGILLVTHGEIGKSLIDCAAHILDKYPISVESVAINSNNDLNSYSNIIAQKIQDLESGNGILIMTDIYGATPCNLLNKFIEKDKVEVVTGINLPMLIKAISDRKDNLRLLTNDSIECAKKNIKKI